MNKNLALVAVFSVILAANVEAQSNLVLRDGDGDGIGTLLGFETALSVLASMYTPDGYLIMFDTVTGNVSPREPIYFATADCSGQAYLRSNFGPDDKWAKRGGGFFIDSNSFKRVAKIDWSPTVVLGSDIFSGGQCWASTSCDGAPISCSPQGEYVPVSYIDNSQYGIKPINVSGHVGFLPPITGQVQTTGDQIFCDSFECKQQ